MQIGAVGSFSFNRTEQDRLASEQTTKLKEAQIRLADMRQDDKALAKARLERAKQFLARLTSWGFPPETIAREAAKLGIEVRAALQQFVASADGTAQEAAIDAQQGLRNERAIETEATENDAEDERLPASETPSFAEKAYLEIISAADRDASVSADDRKAVVEFERVLEELKALQEEAERRSDREKLPSETDRMKIDNNAA